MSGLLGCSGFQRSRFKERSALIAAETDPTYYKTILSTDALVFID